MCVEHEIFILVFLKEIKELVRDRKTLFFMIALPLLVFPAIFGVVTFVSSKAISDAQSEVLDYAIRGAECTRACKITLLHPV